MFHWFAASPFDFDEFRRQMDQLGNARRFNLALSRLPLLGRLSRVETSWLSEREVRQVVAVIDSMTSVERKNPSLIDSPRRRRRLALGAGVTPSEVRRVERQFDTMADVVRRHEAMSLADRFRWVIDEFRREIKLLFGAQRS